ncbi:MAG TPA: hypothetical protein VGI67_19290 [Thermoleophilaceae bacterium]|jgi:hypothetical protein
MTNRADFTDEEWTRLERAPLVAGLAISLADPGGPIELTKESVASLKTIVEAAQTGGQGELVDAVTKDTVAKTQHHENPLSGFKPKGALAGEQILDELRAVNELVSAKATAEDAESFRKLLLTAAQRAAEAAKEGGFLGFHAVRVSEGEQQMLDKLGEVLSAPAG